MTFGQFHTPRESSSRPLTSMADINVTPMVDVMLVLLVIFIIAAPFMTHAVKLDLPQAQSEAAPEQADTVSISFDADGILYWNNQVLAMMELESKLAAQAKKNKQAEIQLRADKATRYEIIAKVMAAAQSQGMAKISFVTDSKQAKKP
ncbi:ExbD/TolR family protein [Undibacterium umbellatum]|uniref:Biopolymer transporter ExbD n=1 Tax=Undibacterium umbellatum TaxID=2762300 RepID=A0ABR6Z5B6_9BURK|nr:biopolymer transporter ExbD [Undibacterium umbellatum]MBC3906920.1 biopolymer transporter ExbD [Undibacterium umbellatum]